MPDTARTAPAAPHPARPAGAAPFVVQQSFPTPRPTTNPYLVMLRDAVAGVPGVEVRTFTWRGALTRRADVFHVHWPEILVSGHSPLKALVRQALTVLLVARLAATRTPIVRTEHNLALPEGISRRERALLRWIERRTTLWIRLNDDTPARPGVPSVTIPHGHYVDWYADGPRPPREPGRATFVGFVRRYKGVEALLRTFRDVPGADRRLHVAGAPSTPELATTLEELAGADDRVSLDLRFLDDADLVDAVRRSELVVLPYREMHNSGGVLTALSLARPVLVPDNDVTRRLADEVGHAWLHRYTGELGADDVDRALERVAALPEGSGPDLSARDWGLAGTRHVAAYRQAVAVLRGTRA